MVRPTALLLAAVASLVSATPMSARPGITARADADAPEATPIDAFADWSCGNATRANPVILLHGLGATTTPNVGRLQLWLRARGFCTFLPLYGVKKTPLWLGAVSLGAVRHVADSSLDVAAFIRAVHAHTRANKVDIVGHSEGGFQALYSAKFHGVAPLIDRIVAIAPPTNGTTLFERVDAYAARLFKAALGAVGCDACEEFRIGGTAVSRLNDGKPIVQPGNVVTVIASRLDDVVTPTHRAFVHESGVHNMYIQDYCPRDLVRHVGATLDPNVWRLVLNSLEGRVGRGISCEEDGNEPPVS